MPNDHKPDASDMSGTSRMRNHASGEELWNTWRRKVSEHGVDLDIGSTLDPAVMQTVKTTSPDVVRHAQQVEQAMRNVERRVKRNRGGFSVPKPMSETADPPLIVCPDCDGTGELDGDTCPRCYGDKRIERPW